MCRRVVCGVVFVIEPGVLSIRGRMTSPRSWTNFRVKTLPLFFSMSGQLSFMVCAISEVAMFGRDSHSQLKSFNRDRSFSSERSCSAAS